MHKPKCEGGELNVCKKGGNKEERKVDKRQIDRQTKKSATEVTECVCD